MLKVRDNGYLQVNWCCEVALGTSRRASVTSEDEMTDSDDRFLFENVEVAIQKGTKQFIEILVEILRTYPQTQREAILRGMLRHQPILFSQADMPAMVTLTLIQQFAEAIRETKD